MIIVAGGCYFWYQHTTAQYERQTAETEAFARQWEKNQKAKPKATTETEQAAEKAPAESNTQTAVKPIANETTPVTKETEATHGQTGAAVEKTETAEVRMSPHGFGPYPNVPEDYPSTVAWERVQTYLPEELRPQSELLSRVLVQLWTSGEKTFVVVAPITVRSILTTMTRSMCVLLKLEV